MLSSCTSMVAAWPWPSCLVVLALAPVGCLASCRTNVPALTEEFKVHRNYWGISLSFEVVDNANVLLFKGGRDLFSGAITLQSPEGDSFASMDVGLLPFRRKFIIEDCEGQELAELYRVDDYLDSYKEIEVRNITGTTVAHTCLVDKEDMQTQLIRRLRAGRGGRGAANTGGGTGEEGESSGSFTFFIESFTAPFTWLFSFQWDKSIWVAYRPQAEQNSNFQFAVMKRELHLFAPFEDDYNTWDVDILLPHYNASSEFEFLALDPRVMLFVTVLQWRLAECWSTGPFWAMLITGCLCGCCCGGLCYCCWCRRRGEVLDHDTDEEESLLSHSADAVQPKRWFNIPVCCCEHPRGGGTVVPVEGGGK